MHLVLLTKLVQGITVSQMVGIFAFAKAKNIPLNGARWNWQVSISYKNDLLNPITNSHKKTHLPIAWEVGKIAMKKKNNIWLVNQSQSNIDLFFEYHNISLRKHVFHFFKEGFITYLWSRFKM